MADNILSDFGINLLEEEIDDVIFQTNEFLCDATFTGSQGSFWWLLFLRNFYHRKHYINQLLTKICSARQISNGTKTRQKRRKIKARTLATFCPCLDIFVSCAKVQFCPVKNKKIPRISLLPILFFCLSHRNGFCKRKSNENNSFCERPMLNNVFVISRKFQHLDSRLEPMRNFNRTERNQS